MSQYQLLVCTWPIWFPQPYLRLAYSSLADLLMLCLVLLRGGITSCSAYWLHCPRVSIVLFNAVDKIPAGENMLLKSWLSALISNSGTWLLFNKKYGTGWLRFYLYLFLYLFFIFYFLFYLKMDCSFSDCNYLEYDFFLTRI